MNLKDINFFICNIQGIFRYEFKRYELGRSCIDFYKKSSTTEEYDTTKYITTKILPLINARLYNWAHFIEEKRIPNTS